MGQKYFPVAFKSEDVRSGDATCLRMCLCQLDIEILCQLDHNVGLMWGPVNIQASTRLPIIGSENVMIRWWWWWWWGGWGLLVTHWRGESFLLTLYVLMLIHR